jgi:hypothetical protein
VSVPVGRVNGLWQAVYIAPSEIAGAMIKDHLTKLGFLVMVRSIGSGQGGAPVPCEVLVPAVEAADAHEALTELLAGR